MANDFSGIYSGGAVTFNPLPYAQMIQRMQQEKQLHQEALDKYYMDLNKGLTSTGMAANDVNDFNNKVNTWRNYVTQNRAILDNPQDKNYGNVSMQAGYLYNDALGHAEQSKQKVIQLNDVNKYRLDHPNNTFTQTGVNEIQRASLPISQGGGDLDWSQMGYDPKQTPFGVNELMRIKNNIRENYKMDKSVDVPSVDQKTKTKYINTTSSYSPQTISEIADYAHGLYQSDQGFKNYIDGLMSDQNSYNELNGKFKQIYGNDYDIKHGEEAAATVLMPQLSTTESKVATYSPYTPYDYAVARVWGDEQKQGQQNNTIDDLVQDQINYAKDPWNSNGRALPVDPATLKAMNISNARLSQDEQHIIPEWQEQTGVDKNNQPILETKTGTPMTIDQWKAALGKRNIGAKYFQQTTPKNNVTSQTQSTTKTIKRGDIATQAAKSGYSAQEYENLLKQNGVKIIE